MRILQVVPYFFPGAYGGPGKIVYEPSIYLAKNGNVVDVLTSDAYDDKKRMPKGKYIKNVKNLKVHYFRNISNFLAYHYNVFIAPGLFLKAPVLVSQSDLVHMHDLYTLGNIWIGFVCRVLKKPYLISVHGCLEKERLRERSLLKQLYLRFFGKSLLKNADLLVATSTKEVEEYEQFGVKTDRIVLVGHAINHKEFETVKSKKYCRDHLDLDNSKFIATYLGRIHKIKGLDLLVKAASILDGKKITIVIAGPDDGYLSELKKLIFSHDLKGKLIVLPAQYGDNKSYLLKASDIMVQPSYSEGFSLALLEYASIGKPLVVTSGCHFDEVEKYKAGIIVDGNPNDIADAINRLADNPDQIGHMSKNAKKLIKENYSAEIIGRKLTNIYVRVINKKQLSKTSS